MFDKIDTNRNNLIDLNEWLEFWGKIKKSGYSDDEIIAELENMKEGEAWTGLLADNDD